MQSRNASEVGMVTAGTRGHVQPTIAISKALKAAGHHATIVAGSNFSDWIRSHGLAFEDIGLDIDQVMATEEAVAWKTSRKETELYHMKRLMKLVIEPIADVLTRILPRFDAIIAGGPVVPVAAATARADGIPQFFLLKQPMYPTKSGPSLAMPIRPNTVSPLSLLRKTITLRGF